MWCSCYYTGCFNALKCDPIPTPGVGLHNFTPIISVIIGGIPPGGIFWKKNPGLTSTHHCIKALSTFPQSFPHMYTLGGTIELHTNHIVYIHYIQLYTVNILSILLLYLIYQTTFFLYPISYLLLYYIIDYIIFIYLIYSI